LLLTNSYASVILGLSKGGANMLHTYEVSVTTNCGCLIEILTRAETQDEAVENIFQLAMGIGRIESVRCIK
jgi:hypothetical protein